MKTRIAAAAAVALLAVLLTGCGEDATPAAEPVPFAASAQDEKTSDTAEATPEQETEPELPAHITSPGEVCDPQNLNDPICAAFYPDQALLNITDRGAAALSDLALDEKRDLAEQACDALASGGSPESTVLVSGDDNRVLFTAAAVAYCPEFAPSSEKWPDRTERLIEHYQGLGEAAAKAEFAEGQMPSPDALGY